MKENSDEAQYVYEEGRLDGDLKKSVEDKDRSVRHRGQQQAQQVRQKQGAPCDLMVPPSSLSL